jgi:hypothetical protein
MTAHPFPTPFGVAVRPREDYRVVGVRPEGVVCVRRDGSAPVQTTLPHCARPASPERGPPEGARGHSWEVRRPAARANRSTPLENRYGSTANSRRDGPRASLTTIPAFAVGRRVGALSSDFS